MLKKLISGQALRAINQLVESAYGKMDGFDIEDLGINTIGSARPSAPPVPPTPPPVQEVPLTWATHPMWEGKSLPPDHASQSEPAAKTSASSKEAKSKEEVDEDDAMSLFSPRLRKLVDVALKDGVLTEAELQVLVKNGEKEGIDADELIMIVNAHLFEMQQKANAAAKAKAARPKASPPPLPGKCKKCGAMNKMTATRCEECGATLTPIAPPPLPNGMARPVRTVSQYDWDNRPVHALSERLTWLVERYKKGIISEPRMESLRASAVRVFGVPNSKEQLIEYISLACVEADSFYAEDGEKAMWRTYVSRAIRELRRKYPAEASDYSHLISEVKDIIDL